ncbi:MAG: hypothetical protein K2K94_04960 [Muribaculaceae bacterium]|nr:hypothetical protein [Muribaculaceae bacterium]
MKRLFTFLAATYIMLSAMAQRPLVTLSHNGELSFFDNLSSLEDALTAAVNGDTIYLSEGNFLTTASDFTINKKVNIIGCGYNSFVGGKISIAWKNDDAIMNGPLFDGVRLDELDDGNTGYYVPDLEIRRCRIRKVSDLYYFADNIIIDKCFIDEIDIPSGRKVLISNSKIGYLKGTTYNLSIENCNIKKMNYFPRTMISSVFDGESAQTNGNHTIHNSLFRTTSITSSSSVYTYNCYYEDKEHLDENLDISAEDSSKYLGLDGTVVGVMGGQFPFSVYPSVPTVDSANSSVEYDAESNKLKVKITVAPN